MYAIPALHKTLSNAYGLMHTSLACSFLPGLHNHKKAAIHTTNPPKNTPEKELSLEICVRYS